MNQIPAILYMTYFLFLVCDVILSCLAGSLRSCLKHQGVVFPEDVTVYYPMNLESSSTLRCFTSFNIFSLPVGTEGAIPRLWELRLRRSNVSSFVEAITSSTIMQLAFLILPASAATRLLEYVMNRASCSINCILGHNLDQDLLLDGSPVEKFIPLEDRGYGLSITIIESKDSFQLAVLAPSSQDYAIKPAQLCVEFARHTRVLSARLTERARVVRARGQKILNSRRNSVFIVEENDG
ncbi:diacyglycerol O-acyltransferase MT1468 [Paramuricea clavata]|nr:diacyglycerol O-acyltransferase MT1468 [Paramuricea clavata]